MKEPTGWVESSLKLSIVERRIEKCQLEQFPDWISHPTDTTLYDATRRQLTADIFIIEIPPLLLLLVIIIEWVITGIKINPCCEFAVTGHNTFWLIGGGGGGTAEWKPFPGLTDMADASFALLLTTFPSSCSLFNIRSHPLMLLLLLLLLLLCNSKEREILSDWWNSLFLSSCELLLYFSSSTLLHPPPKYVDALFLQFFILKELKSAHPPPRQPTDRPTGHFEGSFFSFSFFF